MQNPFTLEGKTILITGASSGIGKAVAQECAAAGATCILTARNEVRLSATLSCLDGEGHQYILADLSKLESIESIVEQSTKEIEEGGINSYHFLYIRSEVWIPWWFHLWSNQRCP